MGPASEEDDGFFATGVVALEEPCEGCFAGGWGASDKGYSVLVQDFGELCDGFCARAASGV